MPEERSAKLHRYWIEFDLTCGEARNRGIWHGNCGVTAWTFDDALRIVSDRLYAGGSLPEITRVIEDIDISTLEPNHVRPNIGVPVWRGIWWPPGRG
jgi:hypothetical protein